MKRSTKKDDDHYCYTKKTFSLLFKDKRINRVTTISTTNRTALVAAAVALIFLTASIFTSAIGNISNQSAWAGTFPGDNGKIAFSTKLEGSGFTDIFVINPDGGGQTFLAGWDDAYDFDASWSADGEKVAFTSETDASSPRGISVVNADGTSQTRLTDNGEDPSWSPDGTKIAFSRDRDGNGNSEIYVMNADGSGVTRLTNTGITENGNYPVDIDPSWSPDGSKIAFSSDRDHATEDANHNVDFGANEIYVMSADDGSGVTRLTRTGFSDGGQLIYDTDPRWSPDGTKIAFVSSGDFIHIHVMNANGGGQTALTNSQYYDENPSWSPDGTKIAFLRWSSEGNGQEGIYVMNADGSGVTRLTGGLYPDWGTATASPAVTTTTLTLNTITSVPWGKDVTVTGKLTDTTTAAGVGGKTITFDGTGADNIPDNVVTNTDGTFTATGASPTTVANGWKVQAHFAGDSTHRASDSTIKSYNTLKHSVALVVSSAATSVPWGKPTSFTATLTDTSLGGGVPISGKTIHFDGTGVIVVADKATDSSGKAIGTGTAPNTVATGWTYQAHFAGDSLYLKKDTTAKTYSTTKHAVSLVVTAASTVPWGRPTTFTATLTDTSLGGVPISGKTIHFDGTGVIPASDKTTDSSGKAIGTGTAPNTVATGWKAQAHFAGDALYLNKDSTVKSYSTTKHATSLTITVSPTTVASDKTYKVYGVLKDSTTGAVLGSKTITFTADSPITISSKTTDSAAGKYDSGSLPAPDDAGTYNIQSHFASDSLYSAKDSAIKTLTVTAAAAQATTTASAQADDAAAPTEDEDSDNDSSEEE